MLTNLCYLIKGHGLTLRSYFLDLVKLWPFKVYAFAKMKPNAYVINTSRGGIIDEADLYEALKSGRIAGAALDVLAQEPPEDSPLKELDNIILSPHIAGLTEEAQGTHISFGGPGSLKVFIRAGISLPRRVMSLNH